MKCPYGYLVSSDFNEQGLACQRCQHYKECVLNYYDSIENIGDNHPVYGAIQKQFKLCKNRINQLINEDNPKITIDEIFDMMLDLELYNKKCKKPKRKRKKK